MFKAADMNLDNKLDVLDLLILKRNINEKKLNVTQM